MAAPWVGAAFAEDPTARSGATVVLGESAETAGLGAIDRAVTADPTALGQVDPAVSQKLSRPRLQPGHAAQIESTSPADGRAPRYGLVAPFGQGRAGRFRAPVARSLQLFSRSHFRRSPTSYLPFAFPTSSR